MFVPEAGGFTYSLVHVLPQSNCDFDVCTDVILHCSQGSSNATTCYSPRGHQKQPDVRLRKMLSRHAADHRSSCPVGFGDAQISDI